MKKVLCVTAVLLAASSALAYGATIGDMADGLSVPVEFASKLLRFACYVTGAALIVGAGMQFKVHLDNPKLTPLFTPIFMVFIGLGLILLPYFTTVFGNSWDPEEQNKTHNQGELKPGKKPEPRQLPVPASRRPAGTNNSTGGGTGHWSEQY